MPSARVLPRIKCVNHIAMMSFVAAQFEADIPQFYDYAITLETRTAVSDNSCAMLKACDACADMGQL